MGHDLTARCASCGYKQSGLRTGTGWDGTFVYHLLWCPACRRHRSARNVNRGCPKCHSRVTVVELDYIEDVGEDLDGPYPCPRCGQRKLSFELEALWD